MHLLVLGCGNIVSRRVLPAARSLDLITRISVASKRPRSVEAAEGVTWYEDYDDALRASGADIAYVSGVNTVHAQWVCRSLERGLHVIVDKPAFLDVAAAERAVAQARRGSRVLAEATVFAYHPQMAAFQSLLVDEDRSSFRVSATLVMPPFTPENFRYRADCGGGCLYDLGPYAAGANRLLFGKAPEAVTCKVLSAAGSPPVDTSFSVLLTHRDGGALTGHFGFVSAYRNHLSVVTNRRIIEAERIFTTPPNLARTIRVREDQSDRLVTVAPADSFALFLKAVADAIAEENVDTFAAALIEDARLVQRLRESTGV